MSASTERKNRQIARSEGTDKKTIAERKEAQKKRKENIKWTVGGIAVVLFFALVIFLNTGAFYRSLTAFTVDNKAVKDYDIDAGSVKFSVADVNYAYNMQFMNIYSTYGQYASMMGLDPSQPLDQQECAIDPEAEEGYTWHDYFMDYTKNQLTEMAAFSAYAKSQGVELTDEDYKTIDETIDSITESAETNGYANANKFLAANYGKGVNTDVVRNLMELELLASKVQEGISDTFSYTDKELKDYYAGVADDYDKFTYSFYLVNAETTTDEEGNATASDEAMAATEKTANDIMDKVKKGDEFETAVASVIGEVETTSTDENGEAVTTKAPAAPTKQEAVAGNTVESAISDWLKNADRKAGDIAVLKSENVGSYVVVFEKRDNNQAPTEESGDMPYCDYIADSLLRTEDLSKWHEDVFEGIEKSFKGSFSGASRYVGR